MKTLPLVSATNSASQKRLQQLNQRMIAFYNGPIVEEYYALAHSANAVWPAGSHHQVVRGLCKPGLKLLDMGCGSGHVAINLAGEGILYTGADWSVKRIDENATRSGQAQFISSSLYHLDLPDGGFDITLTFYVLEHLVWPHEFLKEMVRLTKPGGHLVIECPHFRLNHRIPSLKYGFSVAPLGEKLKKGRLLDAAIHYVQRRWLYPGKIRSKFPPARFPFLINLEPSCLSGLYYPDNDAVYFVDRKEVVALLRTLGALDVTAEVCAQQNRSIPADPCLIVARRGN